MASSATQGPVSAHIQRGRPALALLLAILLPVLIFIVVQATVLIGDTRAAAEAAAMKSARDIMNRVDAEVASDLRALAAVAQSIRGAPISRPRPPPERARYNAEVFPQWAGLLVWSRPQRTALFSSLPKPELPDIPMEWAGEIAASTEPVIGGVERIDGLPAALLHRAMPEDDRDLVLTLAIRPEVFQIILLSELPDGAVGAVVDRRGNFLARSIDFEHRLATPATEYVRNAIASGQTGIYRGRTYEGFENYSAFYKSPATGWSAHIAISNELVDSPRSSALVVAIAGGLLCLALTAGLIFLLVEDNRRRRQAEQSLAQAQKLETLGLLTGGIAHDFNNLLTVMIGSLEKLKRTVAGPAADPEAQRAVDTALASARQAAGLTRSLLAYSRQQTLAPRVIDVAVFAEAMCEIVSRTVGEKFDVKCEADPAGGLVEVDESQLGAAILNLAVNARDAMPEGGLILFLTKPISMPAGDQKLRLIPGEYTRITVQDDGPGMPAEVAARAFEPFYSTKGVGRGTGLGLAQVEGFVRQSGGAADIETATGKGTAIHLYLPRSSKAITQSAQIRKDEESSGVGRLKILLVEDEADVRDNTRELLHDLGHSVVGCAAAIEALELLAANRFDLLFSDVILTGKMNGVELAQAARRLQPGLKILLTTGYAPDAARENTEAQIVLPKPYDRDSLVHGIGEAIRQASPERPNQILLVEDEPLIRMIAVETLVEMGYEVIEAGTAAEALASLDRDAVSLALAIVDLGLPDQPGEQLVAALRNRRPDLPVLVASGREATGQHRANESDRIYALQKPYGPEDLLAAVARIIGAKEKKDDLRKE